MRDGLLPGRQGVSLKLRHLIHRATRAAILTGLDSATRPELLKRIVGQIPLAAPFKAELEGSMARPPTPVHSDDQVRSDLVLTSKILSLQRLHRLQQE